MNESHESDAQPIVDQLNNVQPVADETFENLLETRLTEAWYQQTSKTKQKRLYRVPVTFVASLILVILAGGVVLTSQVGSWEEYSAPQLPLIPTPLPTLQPYTPSAHELLDDIPLIIETDMVAVVVPLNFESDVYQFRAGDIVDIVASFNRQQLGNVPDAVSFEAVELLDRFETDSVDVRIIENATVLRVDEHYDFLVLQVHPQDAVILTWLIDSKITITMNLIPISAPD